MHVKYGIKGQITLNQTQQQLVMQNIGNARFVWNQLLDMWNKRYENNPALPPLSEYTLNNLLPLLKKEFAFLKISDSTSLQQVSADLAGSFKKFFRNPAHFKHPRFKAKYRSKMSYSSKKCQSFDSPRKWVLTFTEIRLCSFPLWTRSERNY